MELLRVTADQAARAGRGSPLIMRTWIPLLILAAAAWGPARQALRERYSAAKDEDDPQEDIPPRPAPHIPRIPIRERRPFPGHDEVMTKCIRGQWVELAASMFVSQYSPKKDEPCEGLETSQVKIELKEGSICWYLEQSSTEGRRKDFWMHCSDLPIC